MKLLLLITCSLFVGVLLIVPSLSAQMPTGTATPDASGIPVTAYKVIEPTKLLKDPTQNIVCAYFVANWGESAWKGTKTNPWSYQALARKRGLRGKWVCDISDNLKEVNGR